MAVVLVTGGCGFIGSHLVVRLVAAGARVSVVDDLSRGRATWLHEEAELHRVDIRDADTLRRVVAATAPDLVVHLAALHFIPEVDGAPELARSLNVGGTRNLLEALKPDPPRLLVFASTAAVYPDRRGPIDESCPPSPADLYGTTKREGERLLHEFAAETGGRCIVARIFNVVGPRETNPHVVPELVGQLRASKSPVTLGNLEPRRDYTDVRDVAAALQQLLALQANGPSTFNVGSGQSHSPSELVRLCEDVLGQSIAVESTPERRRAHDRMELVADTRLLRQTTGWQPQRALRDTLAELLTGQDE